MRLCEKEEREELTASDGNVIGGYPDVYGGCE
jgi:hypothetical protein